jgi:SagB-type dehydrogenase family enzyme
MKEEIMKYYKSTKFHFDNENFSPDFEWPITWSKVFYKTYPRFPSKKLQLSENGAGPDLESLLKKRQTQREFSQQVLDYKVLSHILFYSAGIKPDSRDDIDSAKRMYPSAGARYPVEVYIVGNKVSELEEGLYHFNVKDNKVELLLKKDLRDDMTKILNSEMGMAPLLLILTGVMSRTEVKYGSNAYRFALIEAGHIGQNISLLSERFKLGCCAIGGFDNDKLVKLLDVTEEELPLYVFAMGMKKL